MEDMDSDCLMESMYSQTRMCPSQTEPNGLYEGHEQGLFTGEPYEQSNFATTVPCL